MSEQDNIFIGVKHDLYARFRSINRVNLKTEEV